MEQAGKTDDDMRSCDTRSSDLVRAAQGGDRAALDALVKRYYERVLLIVRMRMGKQMRQYVESVDIVQETFIQAVMSLDSFKKRDDAEFIHWLSKVAENRIKAVIAQQRAQKRDVRRNVDLAPRSSEARSPLEISADAPIPAELAGTREEFEAIVEIIPELKEDQREVIILRHFVYDDSRDWSRIAAALERNTNATRMLYARAVMTLQSIMRRKRSQRDRRLDG